MRKATLSRAEICAEQYWETAPEGLLMVAEGFNPRHCVESEQRSDHLDLDLAVIDCRGQDVHQFHALTIG
jgi:hypothetical protein